jgi:hypothetical protein
MPLLSVAPWRRAQFSDLAFRLYRRTFREPRLTSTTRDQQSGPGRVANSVDKLLQSTNRAAIHTCRYNCAGRVKRERHTSTCVWAGRPASRQTQRPFPATVSMCLRARLCADERHRRCRFLEANSLSTAECMCCILIDFKNAGTDVPEFRLWVLENEKPAC